MSAVSVCLLTAIEWRPASWLHFDADDIASFQSTLVHNIEMRQIVIQHVIRMIGRRWWWQVVAGTLKTVGHEPTCRGREIPRNDALWLIPFKRSMERKRIIIISRKNQCTEDQNMYIVNTILILRLYWRPWANYSTELPRGSSGTARQFYIATIYVGWL